MYTFDEKTVSDLHKDAYGFRPNSLFWEEWNTSKPAQKQVIWGELCDRLSVALEEQKAEEAAAIASFENNISTLIELGARDRDTAIRWFLDSLKLDSIDKQYGGSYVCHTLGLPYSMAAVFNPFLKA